MASIKKLAKVLSLLMIMVIILGTFTSFAYATGDQLSFSKYDLREEALNKIDLEVKNKLEEEDLVEVLVYMKDQADTGMIARATRSVLESTVTPYNIKLQVRRGVVEALKDTAKRTQSNLIEYLKQQVSKGNVVEFKPYHIVNMIYVKGTKEVIENIAYRSEVKKISKNNTYQMDFIKGSVEEIELQSTDPEWNVTRIGADKVWDIGIDGTGVVVGLLDTGVDWIHPALQNKWRGYNPETGETDPSKSWFDPIYNADLPTDPDGHGTHVTGIMLGQEPDGTNKIGVAPGAKWIAARVFDAYGYTTDKTLLDAAEWMLHPGGDPDAAPDVVNNSWGGTDGINDWYRDAVRAWRDAEIFPVFAAGNQRGGEPLPWPGSITVPANYPESFAVGAVDRNDIRASFSKLGPSPYDEKIIKPNISAPGVGVYSSLPVGKYGAYSGTSMAAPHVAGVVALLKSADASLTIEEIEEILQTTADPLTDDAYPDSPNFGYGYGMVNALEAVSQIASGIGRISGRVLGEGVDTGGPVIIHEQETFNTFFGFDINIQAQVIDDVSVTEVELLVKHPDKSYWYTIPMDRISGDYSDGLYEGIIPSHLLAEGYMKYKLVARDFSGEETSTPEYTVEVIFGLVPGEYFQGFEDEPFGWRFEGDWEWGKAIEDFDPAPYEGENLAGTALGSNYNLNTENWLITPPIDLRDSSLPTASFRFYHWFDLQDKWDEAFILITDDYGETWHQAGPAYVGMTNGWEEVMINLEEYIGSPNPIFIAYYLNSDYISVSKGWYVDNVRLYGVDNEPPATPTNLTAEAIATGIRLHWTEVNDIDFSNYVVYRSLEPEVGYELIAEPNGNIFKDTTAEPGITYYYKVAAVDTSGNISSFSNEVNALMLYPSIIYNEDFENSNGGYISAVIQGNNNPWQWGIPTSGPKEAASGERLWATNLVGTYRIRTYAYLESPTISLPDDNNSVLGFTHWVDMTNTENYIHYGQVLVSNDGGITWNNLTPEKDGIYTGNVQAWDYAEIRLDDYKGQDIKIRFYFHADAGLVGQGWYIDDVFIAELGMQEGSPQVIQAKISENIKQSSYENSTVLNHDLMKTKANSYGKVDDIVVQNIPMGLGGIPIEDAFVTVLEIGTSVKVDPVTGKYTIIVPAGEYTLIAEAYGHYSQEAEVTVLEDKTTIQTFVLDPKPKGTIQGRVFDRYYGDSIVNAEIKVVEDPKIPPVVTDENGFFTIPDVIIGDYTLRVTSDGFEITDFKNIIVDIDEITTVELGVKRYVGYEDEIIYDDGIADAGLAATEARNGLAVRFTPERYGMVKGLRIHTWSNTWPVPGGNKLGFTIFGTTEDGIPYMVGEPIFIDNLDREGWNYIDLSSFEFYTDRDFYISTIQDNVSTRCPGVAVDGNSPYAYRSYMYIDGELRLIGEIDSTLADWGLMFRAIVANNANTPVVTNLSEVNYTNQDNITIKGTLNTRCNVNIYVNDTVAATIDNSNLEFAVGVELPQEINDIKITAELEGRETEPCELTVIKDKEAPDLIVDSPVDGTSTNKKAIHVTGSVTDNKGIAMLLINGEEATVNENGSFDYRLMADEGEFLINVTAIDYAGNITTIERTIIVDFEGPAILNMVPAEDIILFEGDTLIVSFNSEPGGQGYFRLGADYNTLSNNHAGIPMIEEEPGLYVGTLVIPEGFAVSNGLVEFEFTDEAGNEVTAIAPGRVTVIDGSVEPMEDLPINAVILGNEAYDINYLNTNSDAQMKLINYYNEGNEVYVKLGEDLIVNTEGEIVGMEVLPDELIYYDANGRITKYVK